MTLVWAAIDFQQAAAEPRLSMALKAWGEGLEASAGRQQSRAPAGSSLGFLLLPLFLRKLPESATPKNQTQAHCKQT